MGRIAHPTNYSCRPAWYKPPALLLLLARRANDRCQGPWSLEMKLPNLPPARRADESPLPGPRPPSGRRVAGLDAAPGDEVYREAAEPVAAFVVLAAERLQAGAAVFAGGGEQGGRARVARRQARGDALQHPGPREVQPVEVNQLRVFTIGDHRDRQPARRLVHAQAGQETAQPRGELRRLQHPAHHVRLGEDRREESLPVRLEREVRPAVLQEVVACPTRDEIGHLLVAANAGPVEDQAQGECGLGVFAGPHRVRELRQPGLQLADRLGLQRLDRGGPLLRLRVVPFMQLRGELQQPGLAVRPLERHPALRALVRHFGGHARRGEALRQGRADAADKRGLRELPAKPDQEPVPVYGRVPVVAAKKDGRQFMRRLGIRLGVHHVGDLVRVFLVEALEGQLGERLDRRQIEGLALFGAGRRGGFRAGGLRGRGLVRLGG